MSFHSLACADMRCQLWGKQALHQPVVCDAGGSAGWRRLLVPVRQDRTVKDEMSGRPEIDKPGWDAWANDGKLSGRRTRRERASAGQVTGRFLDVREFGQISGRPEIQERKGNHGT